MKKATLIALAKYIYEELENIKTDIEDIERELHPSEEAERLRAVITHIDFLKNIIDCVLYDLQSLSACLELEKETERAIREVFD